MRKAGIEKRNFNSDITKIHKPMDARGGGGGANILRC